MAVWQLVSRASDVYARVEADRLVIEEGGALAFYSDKQEHAAGPMYAVAPQTWIAVMMENPDSNSASDQQKVQDSK